MGLRLGGEHGIPGLDLPQAIEPGAPMREEQVGKGRVVGAVAAIASGVDGVLGREEAADRLHVVAEVHDAHRERDRRPLGMVRIAVSVPALEREAECIANAGAEVEPLHEHVGDLAPGREVVDRPLARGLLDHPDDLLALVRGAAGRRERHHVPHDLGGIRGVVHQRLSADGDLVAEHGGDLVGVAGAADVPQQRHPVGGLALLFVEAGGVADPRREQARAQMRLERLPERVVLRKGERRDELAEAERCFQDGESSRCLGRRSPARSSHDASPMSIRARTLIATEDLMAASHSRAGDPIKVGVITDQTGPLSVIGLANANVARMVVGDINAKGGLLGRLLELHLEDSASDDSVAAAKATKLVEHDHVDVVLGGIYSSTRQAIKGPVVVEGKTLYIYPEQYEGEESDPLIFCTGPVPAQQVDPFIPWLMRGTGAKTFYLPSADYIWPHVLNARVREVVEENGGSIVGEEYFPLDHTDYVATVERINASGADVVFNTIVPPGVTPFFEQLYDAGFTSRGGHLVCTYFDENFLNMVPAAHVEGLYGCLDYYQAVTDPFSRTLLERYETLYPGDAKFTGGSACSGLHRGLRLWAAAVTEAGSLAQEDVIAALDHARIDESPGGPAAMAPGQHHLRLNMYIAQARDGRFEIVRDPGSIDPQERLVETAVLTG